jgi:hypothetical protein
VNPKQAPNGDKSLRASSKTAQQRDETVVVCCRNHGSQPKACVRERTAEVVQQRQSHGGRCFRSRRPNSAARQHQHYNAGGVRGKSMPAMAAASGSGGAGKTLSELMFEKCLLHADLSERPRQHMRQRSRVVALSSHFNQQLQCQWNEEPGRVVLDW